LNKDNILSIVKCVEEPSKLEVPWINYVKFIQIGGYATELAPKTNYLHIHYLLLIDHYTKLQLDFDAIKTQFTKVSNGKALYFNVQASIHREDRARSNFQEYIEKTNRKRLTTIEPIDQVQQFNIENYQVFEVKTDFGMYSSLSDAQQPVQSSQRESQQLPIQKVVQQSTLPQYNLKQSQSIISPQTTKNIRQQTLQVELPPKPQSVQPQSQQSDTFPLDPNERQKYIEGLKQRATNADEQINNKPRDIPAPKVYATKGRLLFGGKAHA
jgi:hypothetical protein